MNWKGSTSNATIAFTLPISCQICLGKVKQPVVCPNQHVFCAPCLEMWLERNQQCPACRVYITEDNPCKQVLGGLTPEAGRENHFSSRDLRKARVDLIFKDYEAEIERLEAELEACKQDNKELKMRAGNAPLSGNKVTSPVSPGSTTSEDRTMVTLLNNKIKDATALYEEVKQDLTKQKKENGSLKDQVVSMRHENQSLRLEVAGRSPRRYGRYTVATLETKVEASEKQIKQLQKALEKSDGYIEDLEKQLEKYRNSGATCHRCNGHNDHIPNPGVQKKLETKQADSDFDVSGNLNDSELPSRITTASEAMSDVNFDDSDMFNPRPNGGDKSSFDLEAPSPMTPGGSKVSKSQITDTEFTEDSKNAETEDSFQLPKPSTSRKPELTVDAAKKKLRFTFNDDDSSGDDFINKGNKAASHKGHSKSEVRFNLDKPDSSNMDKSELDVSMTPDLEDCMRIMDEAKRKLNERQYPPANQPMDFTSKQTQPSTSANQIPFGSSFNGSISNTLPMRSLGAPPGAFQGMNMQGNGQPNSGIFSAPFPGPESLSSSLASKFPPTNTGENIPNSNYARSVLGQSGPSPHGNPFSSQSGLPTYPGTSQSGFNSYPGSMMNGHISHPGSSQSGLPFHSASMSSSQSGYAMHPGAMFTAQSGFPPFSNMPTSVHPGMPSQSTKFPSNQSGISLFPHSSSSQSTTSTLPYSLPIGQSFPGMERTLYSNPSQESYALSLSQPGHNILGLNGPPHTSTELPTSRTSATNFPNFAKSQ